MDCSWPNLAVGNTIPLRVLQAGVISPHAVPLVALELLAIPTSILQPRPFSQRSVGSVSTADLVVPPFPQHISSSGLPLYCGDTAYSSFISQTMVTQVLPPLTSESAKPKCRPFLTPPWHKPLAPLTCAPTADSCMIFLCSHPFSTRQMGSSFFNKMFQKKK